MTSRISDTQTFLFTRIPQAITKTWKTDIVNAVSKDKVPGIGRYHENSIINMIELTVEFNDQLTTPPETFGSQSDSDDSHISVWQEARKDWASLESAINNEISLFIERASQRAQKRDVTTVDALIDTHTEYEMPRARVTPSSRDDCYSQASGMSHRKKRLETIIEYPTSNAPTVTPHDSVSSFDRSELRTMMDEMLKSHKSKKKHSKSRGSTVIRYLAEPGLQGRR